MKYLRLLTLLLAVSVGAVLFFPKLIDGQSRSPIIVNDADSTWNSSFTQSTGLNDSAFSVKSRVVTAYPDSTSPYPLTAIPSALQSLAGMVSTKVLVEYADSVSPYTLTSIPSAFGTLAINVMSRIVTEYADSALYTSLSYPITLMDDTQSPQISETTSGSAGIDNVDITWQTDEFADSALMYGEQSGAYSETVIDALYVKKHSITLTGLTPDATYYYKVSSTDRSDNTSESLEYSFTVQSQIFVYLPLVLK